MGKKKNPGKPLKRSPPGFDHLVHTYRGPNDQFLGVQMFLVLEIFFFRNRVFFEPVTFSRYTREQKPPGNLRNWFIFLKKYLLAYFCTYMPRIMSFYPSGKNIFFPKKIFILIFDQKIEKYDAFDTSELSYSIGSQNNCNWSWPKQIWFLNGLWV